VIDKLNLTLNIVPDVELLKSEGKIIEDSGRGNIYKFLCRMDRATLLYFPHKYSDTRNAIIPFSKVDINPKYFVCYSEMLAYIFGLFMSPNLKEEDFKASRVDIAADIPDFPIDCILAMLRIARIRPESLSFYRGTIYAGSDPKIRIYDKTKEIATRKNRNQPITDYERQILISEKRYTRFEIQVRTPKSTLEDIAKDPERFASYFDRLEIFDFKDNDGAGVLQTLYRYINRKFRADLEKYKNVDIVAQIKAKYLEGVKEWFDPEKEPF
jgi:hypothetical protein